MSLTTIEQEIVDEFELFDDAMDKYEHIIDTGKELPAMEEKYKTDASLVQGCQSKVWLRSFEEGGKVYFEADSNTVITKGIIAMLVKVLSGNEANFIVNHPLSFIHQTDLRGHLTSQRSNGLTAMINKMKALAKSYL